MWNISGAGIKYLFRFEPHVVQSCVLNSTGYNLQADWLMSKFDGRCQGFHTEMLNLSLNIEFIMREEGFIPYMITTSDNDILRIYPPSQNKQMVGN